MFQSTLYFAFCAALVSATSSCESVERGSQGFLANFYNYELKDEVGWKTKFFQDGVYNKGEVLHTAMGVTEINFGLCVDNDVLEYGKIYGQDITISNYTIELTGYFTPTSTGHHKFYIEADNGASLKISRGISCCNSPDGDKYGDYELHMLDNSRRKGSKVAKDFYLEDGVHYFIKIVTFNWQASGSLNVGFFTPKDEHVAEMGTMVSQDKYDTKPCPESPNSVPESFDAIRKEQKTEYKSCADIEIVLKDLERTGIESTASSMHGVENLPTSATTMAASITSATDDCVSCSATESTTAQKSSEEMLKAASTTEKSSTQIFESEMTSDCVSCLSTNSKESSLDARPTGVGFAKSGEQSTSVVSAKCIDLDLLFPVSMSKQNSPSSTSFNEAGPSTLVSSSTNKISQETTETTSQGEKETKNTSDEAFEKGTATTGSQRVSESGVSVSPISGPHLPDSAGKSDNASVLQNKLEFQISGAVSANVDLSGTVLPTKESTEATDLASASTGTASTKSAMLSQVVPSQQEARAPTIGQSFSLATESADRVTITSSIKDCTAGTSTTCTENCRVETSTTYVTMTTTNESGKTVTVTYCPSTDQAQPSDICIAGDSVCLSYAASVNVYPTPAIVNELKATESEPSAARPEGKVSQVMENAKQTEEANSTSSGGNFSKDLQPSQSVEIGSSANVTPSGNSRETTSAQGTSRNTFEDTVSVTITSTTGSKAGPSSAVSAASVVENEANAIKAFASLNSFVSVAVALITLLVFA